MPVLQPDAPVLGLLHDGAVYRGDDSDDTQIYVENWLLWVVINVISVVIFALRGVYACRWNIWESRHLSRNGGRLWMKQRAGRIARAFPLMVMNMPGWRLGFQMTVGP